MKHQKRGAVCFCLAVLLLLLSACGTVFRGEREATDDRYRLEIYELSGSDTHTFSLVEGDVLRVHFAIAGGEGHLTVTDSEGKELYSGNGEGTPNFALSIREDGDYTVTLTGKGASGNLLVERLPYASNDGT